MAEPSPAQPAARGALLAALAASVAVSLAELAALALRSHELDARRLGALVLFALVAGAALGALAGALAAVRREAGVAWALGAWAAIAVVHFAGVSRAPLAGKLAGACAALALGYCVVRVVLHVARRAPALVSGRAWLALDGALLAALALLVVARRAGAEPDAPAGGRKPSILLVTIDTLRADFLGCFGRREARTATIDGLAAQGHLFEHALTHTVLTGPSHATILTGLLPIHHGLTENLQRLSHSVPTVAERLAARGYRTGAFVAGYPLKQSASAMLERFESWDDDFRGWRALPTEVTSLMLGRWLTFALESSGVDTDPHSRAAPAVTDSAVAWIDEPAVRPFFAWVHYFDPHLPYDPPREFLSDEARAYHGPTGGDWYRLSARERAVVADDAQAMRYMNELYDAEIAATDRELARLIAAARARAGADGLWIVLTSDHGESFGEHGIFFERDLYEDCLHVPLIVVPPAPMAGPRHVAEPVGLVDLAPTLLEIAGDDFAGDGSSLLALLRGEPWKPRRYLSEIFPSTGVPFRRGAFAVRDETWKLIVRPPGWNNGEFARARAEERELYDLARDPAELDSVAPAEKARADGMQESAAELHRREASAPLEMSERQREQLKSLGYVR